MSKETDKEGAKALVEFARDVRFWITVITTGLASMGVSQVGTSAVSQDVSVTASVTAKALNDHAAHISELSSRYAKLSTEHAQTKTELETLKAKFEVIEKALASGQPSRKMSQLMSRLNEEQKSTPSFKKEAAPSPSSFPLTVPSTLQGMKSNEL